VTYNLSDSSNLENKIAFCVHKKFGNAPRRNKVKRILREIYRKNRHKIKLGFHIAIIPGNNWLNLDNSRKETEFYVIFKKAGLMLSQNEISGNSTD